MNLLANRIHKKFTYFFTLKLALICSSLSFGQTVINGSVVHTLPNSIIYINTDSFLIENEGYVLQEGLMVIDKDLVVNDGQLDIDGTIDVNENIINNDSIEGFSASSIFLLNGNWINNSIFIPGVNTTVLDGNAQNVSGSSITNFYDLEALGGLADVKRLVGINSIVLNELNLTDVEFATDENTLTVLNPNVNAIQRNSGFVSSLDVGRLERATNSILPYLFPTGSTAGVLRYRPIELAPNNAALDTFGVRLANTDATSEGFDVMVLSDSLCAVNPNFYHRIYGDAAADITMFYIPAEDGEWNAMAQWQDADIWDKLPNEMPGTSGQFSTISVPGWSDYSNPAFALGTTNPLLDLIDSDTIVAGQSTTITANYTGPNPQSIVWFPFDEIDCFNCLDPEFTPTETTTFNLEIMVTQTCILRDSVLIFVNPGALYLPTAFSPNSDGVNDLFRPLNDKLDAYEIFVYNRWGELVYQSDDMDEGWNGTYKGAESGIGVYSFYVEYQLENQTEVQGLNGNVTLIR